MKSFRKREFEYVMERLAEVPGRILDVGCGQGRYLVPLSRSRHVVGVEKSADQISRLTGAGFHVVSRSEIVGSNEEFDCVLMSHVLEHVAPQELVDFLDGYLDLLRTKGRLVVATPLPWRGFYDDYDHVKPYTHTALNVLFSNNPQQQDKTRNEMKMLSLWIRRYPYDLVIWGHERRLSKMMKLVFNRVMLFAYRSSGARIGKATGWVGVYEKSGLRIHAT